MKRRIVLGIESAIAGGSICLTSDDREIGSWIGREAVSKAEDLLPNVDRILRENQIDLDDIDQFIVSIGPGSFTGIKIGIATLLGFREAINASCFGISILDALWVNSDDSAATTVVPVGRGMICYQTFVDGQKLEGPVLLPIEAFSADQTGLSRLVLHGSIYDRERFPNAVDAGWNMAFQLCMAVDSKFSNCELRPLFVEQKSGNI